MLKISLSPLRERRRTSHAARMLTMGAVLAFAAGFAQAAPDALEALLQARLQGDRTGACVVAAVVDHDSVTRARYCGRASDGAVPGYDDAFEIGSVTKTMTAFLVADLIEQKRWSLDDPIAAHLPPGTAVPRQGERQILVRDLVTHRSGLPALPARFHPGDMTDPYASLTPQQVLQSLGDVHLTRPIGAAFEYSNFGMMVLSLAVAQAYGIDLESALHAHLFAPLHMDRTWISRPPDGAQLVPGHLPSGKATPPWTIAVDLAGVGMVRSTLDDMVRYAQAELGASSPDNARRMRLTQTQVAPGIAMNWLLANVDGHDLVLHEGATGGFSSVVVLEPSRQRAAVILADTALGDVGGLGELALAALLPGRPAGTPRVTTAIPASLRAAIEGSFDLGPMTLTIRSDGERLLAQATGQPAFELFHDSHGDLYPTVVSALLTPEMENGRIDHFVWHQSGGAIEARRRDAVAAAVDPRWKDWVGDYDFTAQFAVRVFEEGGHLMIRATGQPALQASVAGTDRIEVAKVGAVLQFERDAAGVVIGVKLMQHGQTLAGTRRSPGG